MSTLRQEITCTMNHIKNFFLHYFGRCHYIDCHVCCRKAAEYAKEEDRYAKLVADLKLLKTKTEVRWWLTTVSDKDICRLAEDPNIWI